MKTSELQALKELSSEAMSAFPPCFTVDGRGSLYCGGRLDHITILTVLGEIEAARDKLCLLDQTIQALEGRKAPK